MFSIWPGSFQKATFPLWIFSRPYCKCILWPCWTFVHLRGNKKAWESLRTGRGPCLITHPTSVQTSSPSACLPTYPVPTQSQILFRIQKITQRGPAPVKTSHPTLLIHAHLPEKTSLILSMNACIMHICLWFQPSHHTPAHSPAYPRGKSWFTNQ